MTTREHTLRQLAQQMQQLGIAPQELQQELQGLQPQLPAQPAPVLALQLGAVAGCGLLAAFTYAFWPSLSPALRILLTLGVGMFLHMLAMMAWPRPRQLRLGQGLLLAAALWQGFGWMVVAQRVAPGWAPERGQALLACGLMLAQGAVLLRHYRRGFLLAYTLAFAYGFMLSLLITLGGHPMAILVALGVSMFGLAAQLSHGPYAGQSGLWQMLGGALLFFALYKLSIGTPLEAAYVLAALCAMAYGARHRLRALLLLGTLAMAAYLLHAALDYALASSLWPYALVFMGVAQAALAVAALSLWRRFGGFRPA